MSGVEIVTFGCRLNAFESEIIRRAAAEAGLEGAVIVNTCAVTAEAERQARQAIRRARREHPGAKVIVTGCAATLAPERYAALAEVDLVLNNDAKLKPESYAIAPHPSPLPAGGEREPAGPPQPLAPVTGGGGGPRAARGWWRGSSACGHICRCSRAATIAAPSASSPTPAAPAV